MNSWYPPSKPRPVSGGIAARSSRGAIAQTWWSGRFIEVLESIGLGARLQRGRSYARKGQVIDLDLDAGRVSATVQGSRVRPYRVRISLTAYGKSEWALAEHALATQASYTAALLAGRMPADIEEVFASVGLSLFPANAAELSLDCSCPDPAVPCKHLAAVCYLLAESFDDDPFRILAWRGREREDLLANLRALRTAGGPAADATETGSPAPPLSECLEGYFRAGGRIDAERPPETAVDALLSQAPALPLAARGTDIVEALRPLYRELGCLVATGADVSTPAHGSAGSGTTGTGSR
jgi:uncharacterized Zn finger protein